MMKLRLLVLLLLSTGLASSAAAQSVRYVSPEGADSNTGATPSAAWASFEHAVPQLTAGDTLVLLDGVYTEPLSADCADNARRGSPLARITVRAHNERKAWMKGDGSFAPVRIVNCSYWDIIGLRASSADFKDGAQDIVLIHSSNHIRAKRLLLHDANRYENSDALQITTSHHVLVEDVEAYYFHRHAISAYKADHVTIRRSYVNARGATDLDDPDAWGSHRCCQKGGDEGFSFYFTSNSILENSISVDAEHLSIISGVETVLGNPGGQNNKILGSISYKDLRPGFIQSRKFLHPDRPYTGPADNIEYRDYLVVGGQENDRGAQFALVVGRNALIDGATFVGMKHEPISMNPATRELRDRFFLGCDREEVGGCRYVIRRALFIENGRSSLGTLLYAPDDPSMEVIVEESNAWPGFFVQEDVADRVGQYRFSSEMQPTHMGADGCLAYVPKSSNMARPGRDVGAEILYRYVDGRLTDEPLWDPETGAFPHGAVIAGVNDVPGQSLFDLHELLDVDTPACPLPYDASMAWTP